MCVFNYIGVGAACGPSLYLGLASGEGDVIFSHN